MTTVGDKHTATISVKPSGSGSMNVPQDVLEALTGGEGTTVVFIVRDDGTARLVPLEKVLLGDR
ncbi:hypothetical protein [Halorussus aquaticus]|uniref:SpoVT-AbrB domain-containing protein n=1 Tax=Halorussus aquaticus TaxID=2953748 RepID=A0ABD5Q4D5_9EURY|nr:hypothetical protein [Halorussus aquaticus]